MQQYPEFVPTHVLPIRDAKEYVVRLVRYCGKRVICDNSTDISTCVYHISSHSAISPPSEGTRMQVFDALELGPEPSQYMKRNTLGSLATPERLLATTKYFQPRAKHEDSSTLWVPSAASQESHTVQLTFIQLTESSVVSLRGCPPLSLVRCLADILSVFALRLLFLCEAGFDGNFDTWIGNDGGGWASAGARASGLRAPEEPLSCLAPV
jgi:hypothetical protein